MAEVQAHPRPSKKKAGALAGFLAGNESSTHAFREEKVDPKTQKAQEMALDVCADVAIDALLLSAKKSSKLPTTDAAAEAGDAAADEAPAANNSSHGKRTKPRKSSSRDPLTSQSAHIPRTSLESKKSKPPKSNSYSSSSSNSNNNASASELHVPPIPRKTKTPKRSQSTDFHKSSSFIGQETKTDIANPSSAAREAPARRKPVSRSKSFDGDAMGPLQRVTRSRKSDAQAPGAASTGRVARRGSGVGNTISGSSNNMNTTPEEKKKRSGSKDIRKSKSELGSGGEEKERSQRRLGDGPRQPSQRKLVHEKKASSKQRKEKTPDPSAPPPQQQQQLTLSEQLALKAKASPPDKIPSEEECSIAFTTHFGEQLPVPVVPVPVHKTIPQQKTIPQNRLDDNEDDSDDETMQEEPGPTADIIQFDPTSTNNVKMVLGDSSISQFPSMACPDMGLGDILLGDDHNNAEEPANNHADKIKRSKSHDPCTSPTAGDEDEDNKGGRWGKGFGLFKLKKSNSFKFPTIGHQQLDDMDTSGYSR